jgi:hypothetical protein
MVGDGGPATSATVAGPSQVEFDAAGNMYVYEAASPRIRKISPQVIIQTLIGTGQTSALFNETVASPEVPISRALSLLVAADGSVYLDQSTGESKNKMVKIAPDGAITTVGHSRELPGLGPAATILCGGRRAGT